MGQKLLCETEKAMEKLVSLNCNPFLSILVWRDLSGVDERIATANLTNLYIEEKYLNWSINIKEGQMSVRAQNFAQMCGAFVCTSGDGSVLDAFPMCESNSKAVEDNSYAIIILSVGLIILLVIAIAGWLDKCKTFCESVLKEQKVAEEEQERDSTIPQTQSTTDSEGTSHPERTEAKCEK